MRVLCEAVKNGGGKVWIANGPMPVLDRKLAGHDGGTTAMLVVEDFDEIPPFRHGHNVCAVSAPLI